MNRARNVDHAARVCKRFVHSIVFEKFTRCAKVCGLFSLDCPFQALIGWAGKRRSHGSRFCTAPANDYRVLAINIAFELTTPFLSIYLRYYLVSYFVLLNAPAT